MTSTPLYCRRAVRPAGWFALALAATLSAFGQTLEEALDAPGVVWTTTASDWAGNPTPGGEWAGQTAVAHDSADAARSGPVPAYNTSRLKTTSFSGPGTLTFWRRHGIEGGENPLSILANGSWVGLFLPGGAWQPMAIDLPPGPATIEFSWYNTYSDGTEPDAFAYVDEVAFHGPGGFPQFAGDPPDLTVGEGHTIQPAIAVLGEKPMDLELTHPDGSKESFTLPVLGPGSSPAVSGWQWGYEATPVQTGVWTVKASNTLAQVTRTFTVTVNPSAPHSIYIYGPYQAWAGANVTLTANARGTAPLTYQWRKGGADLSGKTSQSLVLTGFSQADEGEYTVVVSNALGSRSASGYIQLGNQAPALLTQPASEDLALYGYTYLAASFDGTPPFDVAWRRDGAVVQGDPAYNWGSYGLGLGGSPETTPGVYSLTVANGLGTAQTTPIVLQVGEGANIADAVDNRSVGWRHEPFTWASQTAVTHDGVDAVGILGQWPTPLRTAVEGPAAVSFWWRVNHGTLNFTFDSLLQQTLSAPNDTGWQQVTVSLGAGWHQLEWQTEWFGGLPTVEAYLDEFTVAAGGGGPVIVTQPQGGDYLPGEVPSVSVTVTGTGPFSYRLFKDETLLETVLNESAATYAFPLTLDFGSAGAYWIEVIDTAGRAVASDDAVISVNGGYGSLINLATALSQPGQSWAYSDFSALEGSGGWPIHPWYRTRADGVPAGFDRSARTPPLNAGELAALVMEQDALTPLRLRFWMKFSGALPDAVFGLSANGVLLTPTRIGSLPGTSGESWTGFEVLLPSGYLTIQWEIRALTPGVVAYLGSVETIPALPPALTRQPANLAVPAGEAGALSVIANSPVPVTYQWFKVGTGALPGKTTDTLTFSPATTGDAGQFFVRVSNDFGTTQSDTVTVSVTGARPRITQPLQPQWLRPGDALHLEVTADSRNNSPQYRWLRDDSPLPGESTASLDRIGATTSDAGVYRVEVFDGYYTTFSEAKVVVSPLLYQVTWLPSFDAGGYAQPQSINNAGVVAGYAGGAVGSLVGSVAMVWQGGVPTRLTLDSTPSSLGFSINDAGQVVGIVYAAQGSSARTVARWSPPYTAGVFDDLGLPAGHPFMEELKINNVGDIVGTEDGLGYFGRARFVFRYTTAGQWQDLGPLTGALPLPGATDQGWATALGMNNAGVIVGLSYFQEPTVTQATGWIFDPTVTPPQRRAMDAISADLAPSPTQPMGWADAVNDLGEVVARRYGAGGPTKLFLIRPGGRVDKLLELPAQAAFPAIERFNIDALNNRYEMVGLLRTATADVRAALARDRHASPGGSPASFDAFALYDLNDLVAGGTGELILRAAVDINDAGQIVGGTTGTSGAAGGTPGFLLTPLDSYAGLPARAVNDVVVRRAGQGIRFSTATLTRNDLGAAPLAVTFVAATSTAGATIVDQGGGGYLYSPAAGPDAPDRFNYTVQAADGSSATGTVHILIESEPPPASNELPVQMLPGGQVRVRFVGLPGHTYRIEGSATVFGPWFRVATVVADANGIIECIETPPAGVARFYRTVE